MKIKILSFALSLSAAMTLLTGCAGFLDADNKSTVTADAYFSTEEGLSALRVNLYTSLKALVTNVNMTEWGTDLYAATRGSDPGDFQKYGYTPENSGVSSYWKSCYELINNANGLIKYGSGNAAFVAEARFFRAYGHYLLSQQFGAVPYVTDFIESDFNNYPRKPLDALYAEIVSELEALRDDTNLPETDHKGHVSRQAVKALLAKVCLAAAWDLETTLTDALEGTYTTSPSTYTSKASQYAEEAIGGVALTMSFEDKWSYTNEGNAEEIFSVQYERNGYPGDAQTGGHGRQNTYGSNYGDPAVTGLKSCSGTLAFAPKALYLWDKGDTRYEATFMTTIYNYFGEWPKTGYYAYYHATEAEKAAMGIADRYFPWYVTKAEAQQYITEHNSQFVQGEGPNKCHVHILADPAIQFSFNFDGSISETVTEEYYTYISHNNAAVTCVKKFDDPATIQLATSSNDYRDIVVFHVSDMYLMAAEAYMLAGDETKALEYINAVRSRAGATTLSAYSDYTVNYVTGTSFGAIRPVDLILDERARELYAETTRWTDLRRTRQLVRYNVEFNKFVNSPADMSNVKGEVKWYKPIPASEIATNSGISDTDQNPGY